MHLVSAPLAHIGQSPASVRSLSSSHLLRALILHAATRVFLHADVWWNAAPSSGASHVHPTASETSNSGLPAEGTRHSVRFQTC